MRRSRLTALVVLGVLAAAPAAPQEPPAPATPAPPPIAVGSDAVPDAAIADRLRGIFDALPALQDVTVSVRAGVVTLGGSVAEIADSDRAEALAERVEGVVAVRGEVEATRDVGERLLPAFDRVETRLRQTVAAVPLFLLGLAAFLAIAGLGVLLTRRWGFYTRLAPNSFIADIYRTLLRVGFVVAGIAVMLDVLGATALLGTILGAAGIIGLAVGFGVRDTIENFVASVMLSLRQPFAPNDLVEIDGELGNVILLNSRATVLLSPDGNHVRLPNSVVFKSKIVNLSREPQRRFVFDLGVDTESDLAAARRIGLAAMRKLAFVLDEPAVAAWIEDVGDSTVVIRFAGWIDQRASDFLTARGEAIRIVKDALEGAGFALPEPIYRVRLDRRRAGASDAAGVGDAAGTVSAPGGGAAVPEATEAAAAAAQAPKDPTIERKAAADRRSSAGSDLLGRGGAPE